MAAHRPHVRGPLTSILTQYIADSEVLNEASQSQSHNPTFAVR
jgi:hypothetical protein